MRALLQTMGEAVSLVGEASDGEAAWEVVRRERPAIVITDLVMPRLNGVELTRLIRQELPRTKIIQISSHTEDAYRLMASDSGADIFVNKSVISDALVSAVRTLISRIDGEASPQSPGPLGGAGAGG
jgi:two-component system response regulator YesN